MPPGWIAALHDAPRLAALQAGIAAAVQQAALASGGGTQQPLRVLVCGGLGLEAVLAAQAGASAVTLFCEGNPLAAHLAAELAADSGCADRLSTATAAAQLGAEAQPGSYSLVILADALGSSIDWGLLQRQLAAAAPLLPQPSGGQGGTCYGTPVLLPHAVRIRGQLVECAEAVALNEVRLGAGWAVCNHCYDLPALLHEQPAIAVANACACAPLPHCSHQWCSLYPIAGQCSPAGGKYWRPGPCSRQPAAAARQPLGAAARLPPHRPEQPSHPADRSAGQPAALRPRCKNWPQPCSGYQPGGDGCRRSRCAVLVRRAAADGSRRWRAAGSSGAVGGAQQLPCSRRRSAPAHLAARAVPQPQASGSRAASRGAVLAGRWQQQGWQLQQRQRHSRGSSQRRAGPQPVRWPAGGQQVDSLPALRCAAAGWQQRGRQRQPEPAAGNVGRAGGDCSSGAPLPHSNAQRLCPDGSLSRWHCGCNAGGRSQGCGSCSCSRPAGRSPSGA